jgi:hypothetical protein
VTTKLKGKGIVVGHFVKSSHWQLLIACVDDVSTVLMCDIESRFSQFAHRTAAALSKMEMGSATFPIYKFASSFYLYVPI